MPLNGAIRVLALLAMAMFAPCCSALCTLVCSCSVSTTPIVFPAYNPLSSANSDSSGKIRVSCGGIAGLAIPYTVALSAGTSGSMAARQMAFGANRLVYNLYTTASFTGIWGDGTGATATVGGGFLLDALGIGATQDLTVYGRIPGSQGAVVPGTYVDTLVVTLTYY